MKIRWTEDRPLPDEIRSELSKAINNYFDTGDKAFRKKIPWTKLHQFRLESKRFRYTLELFVDFYGPPLQRRIKELKDIQTYLGDINDLIATRALLKGHRLFKKDLMTRADHKMAKLRDFWHESIAAEGRREAWLATVSKPKLSPGKRTR